MKSHLRLPGPTEVPDEVMASISKKMIGHRSEEFKSLFKDVSDEIKSIYETENEVLIYPGAGTGGMEAAIVNMFSPNDKVVVLNSGNFGERFCEISSIFGLDVINIDFEWGEAIDLDKLDDLIKKDKNKEIKGVIATHNETSTGVLNNISQLKNCLSNHPAITIVDAVSSLGAIELKTDDWNIDVVITGSQKALMLPPGLTFLSISDKGWEANNKSKLPKFYWDFKKARDSLQKNETPYTPAVPLIYGLEKVIKIIKKEGLENVQKRHLVLSKKFREGVKALGLELFVEDKWASPTVTSIVIPAGINPSDFRRELKKNYNISIAGGQKKLKEKIIRVGHMGRFNELDIYTTLWAMSQIFNKLGFENDLSKVITQFKE